MSARPRGSAATSATEDAGRAPAPPIRVVLLRPTSWLEARGGSERLIRDLAVSLAARGHAVTLLTSHRGRRSIQHDSGVRVIRRWRPPERTPLTWYEHHVANIPGVAWHLCRGDYDVAHAFFPAEGWAALRARRFGGPPVAFSFHGIPKRRQLVGRRYRLEMIEALVRGADAVSVPSAAAGDRFRAYFARDPLLLPPGVHADELKPPPARTPEPTLICTASIGDPRNRSEVLFSAFEILRRRRPDARLRLVRPAGSEIGGPALDLPQGVDWIDRGGAGDGTGGLAGSWASVHPAPEEAVGQALLESLAAGTPVVAARSGACPEIVDDERIGRLFEPDDASDLARCIEETLMLAGSAATRVACRAHAASYDWARVASLYEGLYASLAGGFHDEAEGAHAVPLLDEASP